MAGRFGLDLRNWVKKAKGNERLVVKKVVLDLGTNMAIRTPVGDPDTWAAPAPAGYVGGRARGSWQHSTGAPMTEEPGGEDTSGSATIGKMQASIESGDPLVEHFIVSNVPYMRELEYEGHSKQAPEGMVRITVLEYQTFVNNAVKALP